MWMYSDFIFSVSVVAGKIAIEFGHGWEDYLKECNIAQIIDKANEKIQISRKRTMSKGKGKGGMKGKGKSADGVSH